MFMAAFDHLVLLFSFVYALALTHVLSRAAGLLFSRDRVRFSGLLPLWMINSLLLVFTNWLSLWDARQMPTWTLYSIALQFVFAISIYFVCAMAAPEYPAEGVIDMEEMYARTRVPLYGLYLALCLVGFASNLDLMQVNAPLFLQQNLVILGGAAFAVLALTVRARWAQWAAAVIALLLGCAFLLLFEAALR
jgi:hypothetical protein